MTTHLYAKYLLVDRLSKIAEAAGLTVDYIKIGDKNSYAADVHLQVSFPYRYVSGEKYGQRAEDATVALLDAMPELRLERNDGLIHLKGETRQGFEFEFYTGNGTCELVQVGTRTVPAQRRIPAVKAQPAYEEPVFERRCPDPLNALVAA